MKSPMKRLCPLLLAVIFCLTFGMTGCTKIAKKETPVPVQFDIRVESGSGDKTAATPLLIHINGKTKQKKAVNRICMLWMDTTEGKSMELLPGTYKVEYVSPINSDGSIYTVEGNKELVLNSKEESKVEKKDDKKKKETSAVSLKSVSADEVTPDMLRDTVDKLNAALKDIVKDSDGESIISNKDEKIDKKMLRGLLTKASDIVREREEHYERIEKAADAFVHVLENPGGYASPSSATTSDSSLISWSYSVASLSEDHSPCLLLNARDKREAQALDQLYIGIPDENGKDFHIINSDTPIQYGVSGGGFRGTLTTDGSALYYTTWSSGTGEGEEIKYTVSSGSLSETTTWKGNIFEDKKETGGERAALALTPTWNKKYLYDGLVKQGGNRSLWDSYKKSRMAQEGVTQYTGTVRLFDSDEALCAFQGTTNPNPGSYSHKYVVLAFDQPTQVTARNGDGRGERVSESKMLLLDSAGLGEEIDECWNEYKDKHVTVQFSKIGWFPSDTGLPLGEPRFKDVTDIFED